MLSMGRKPGQYVVIGEDVVVQVLYSADGVLRLAIDAPKNISICRGEAYELEHQAPTCIQKLRDNERYQPLHRKNVAP